MATTIKNASSIELPKIYLYKDQIRPQIKCNWKSDSLPPISTYIRKSSPQRATNKNVLTVSLYSWKLLCFNVSSIFKNNLWDELITKPTWFWAWILYFMYEMIGSSLIINFPLFRGWEKDKMPWKTMKIMISPFFLTVCHWDITTSCLH